MPTYVLHGGRLVDKRYRLSLPLRAASDLPAPTVHSFESFESPIDGRTISSHRQRDKDMHHSGSYDPRDTPVEFRKAKDGRRKQRERSPAQPS